MQIRAYTEADYDDAMELVRRFHGESRFASMTVSESKLKDLERAILYHPHYFGQVIEADDKLVGVFIACAFDPYWSDELMTSDLAFYVLPEYRGKSAMMMVRLIKLYSEWSKAIGATEESLSVNTGIESERTGKFLMRLGYEPVGYIYRK